MNKVQELKARVTEAEADFLLKDPPAIQLKCPLAVMCDPRYERVLNSVNQLKAISALLVLADFDVEPHDRLRFLFVLDQMKERLDALREKVE